MNYRETLFFIGNCLTLERYPDRIIQTRNTINNGGISWEKVVWTSSDQLVLPVLYLQFQRCGLLEELPYELTEHLKNLYQLNHQRNQCIVSHSNDLIELLNSHGISPIFIKGAGNLFDNLYQDIGERMISDIDILLAEEDVIRTADILMKEGYTGCNKHAPKKLIHQNRRHYPRLIKNGAMAGVEIHYRPVPIPFDKKFGFEQIDKNKRRLSTNGEAYVLSDAHQIILNMMNVLMNSMAYISGIIHLRHCYDLFILSSRKDPLLAVREFGHYYQRCNAYLALTSKLLGSPPCLPYKNNMHSRVFTQRFMVSKRKNKNNVLNLGYLLFIVLRLGHDIRMIISFLFNKNVRRRIVKKLKKPEWLNKHFDKYKNVAC